MPHYSPKTQQLDTQAAHLEERYQTLVHQFRAAQLQFQAVRTQHHAVQQECAWLQQVVCAKQRVIEHLLPYYTQPLTPELLYAIELY
jgi:siroheme synthase